MAKRRYQGFGRPYYSRGRGFPKRKRSGWFVKFYEPGAIVTYRLVKSREDKR